MNPHNLENEELDYELSIRGIVGLTNVDAKRRALRMRLKDEKKNPGEKPAITHESSQLQVVAQDIMSLEALLSVAVANKNHRVVGPLYSRLIHCQDRLSRILPEEGNLSVHQAYTVRVKDLMGIADEFIPRKNQTLIGTEALPMPSDLAAGNSTPNPDGACALISLSPISRNVSSVHPTSRVIVEPAPAFNLDEELRKATQLVEDLKLMAARHAVVQVPRVPIEPLGSAHSLELTESSSESEFAEIEPEPRPRNPHRRVEVLREEPRMEPRYLGRRGLPISKWSIRFSGNLGLSLQDFLSQIEILSVAEKASANDLLRSAIYLFEGNAKTWYLASRLRFNTWEDLTRALKEQFLPRDYDYWLMKDIENRYQGASESFGLYFSHMEIMFQQLAHPVPGPQKLAILMRNILPSYADRLALVDVFNVESLQRACKRIEEAQYASSRRNVYPEPAIKISQSQTAVKPKVSTIRVSEPVVPMSPLRCFNCLKQGHHFNDCPDERGCFCFRCGKPDTVSFRCTKCNPGLSGNQ